MSSQPDSVDTSSGWRAEMPFNELPALPPLRELETKPVLKTVHHRPRGVAELKQAAELIPNQGVLINTLPLLEAQASSAIENIVTTTDRLFGSANSTNRPTRRRRRRALQPCAARGFSRPDRPPAQHPHRRVRVQRDQAGR